MSPNKLATTVGLFCLLAAAGCADDATGASSTDAAVVDAPGADSNVAPLDPCEDNVDCAGGEVCRDAYCREACGGDDPCRGALPSCDLELGYCVECVQRSDCAANEACRDSNCVFSCIEDSACDEDSYCDLESGECAERECEEDGGCSGGYQCRGYVCLAIDDIICEPGGVSCEANTRVTCSQDGTSEDRVDCGVRRCVSDREGANCVEIVCVPNDLGCVDRDTAFVCDGTGTVETELPCPRDHYCADATCRPQVCEPNMVECDGNLVVTCDELGASVSIEHCAGTVDCVESDFGCACSGAECQLRVCTPGSSRCVGDSAQACSNDGLGYAAPEACEEDERCVAGACLARECEAGERVCVGDTVVECGEDGSSHTGTDCTQNEEVCVVEEAGAACVERTCVPDARDCDVAANAVVSCDARGAEEATTACDEGDYCASGVCLDQVCSPGGSNVCVLGDVRRCNILGSGYDLVEDCRDDDQRCRDGACLDLACEASVVRCSGDTLLECSLDGLTESPTNCAESSGYCNPDSLACVPWVCVPGQRSCEGGDAATCNPRGSAFAAVDECGHAECSDGECQFLVVSWYFDNGRLCGHNNIHTFEITLLQDDVPVLERTATCDATSSIVVDAVRGTYDVEVLARNLEGDVRFTGEAVAYYSDDDLVEVRLLPVRDPCRDNLEVCNGRDDNCDDNVDNGLNCGTCPSGFGTMALVVREGGAAFCIDVYEASREDATIDSVGTSAHILAHSTVGVLPWSNLGLIGARTACQGAGKRLCSVTEWQDACGGIDSWVFPYSDDTYSDTACNGLDAGEGRAGPSGSRALCQGPDGSLDMSGNLAEWVEGGKSFGGSFNSAETQLRCDQPGSEPDLSAPGPSVGFRCCADAIAPTD